MASKEKMLNGVADYIDKEVIGVIPEKGLQILLDTYIKTVLLSPALLDKYVFKNPMIGILLIPDENGEYDIDLVLRSLKDAMSKYGNLELTIPKIPLIPNSSEKTLTFKVTDVDNLRKYIER